jgi:thiamine pyrophosphate-dependent acetolactate synthase large subunit-like protein
MLATMGCVDPYAIAAALAFPGGRSWRSWVTAA